MRIGRAVLASGAAFVLTASGAEGQGSRVSADYLFRAGNSTLTLAAGGAAFTAFQQDPALQVTGVPGGGATFTRRVSAQTTATGSATLSLWTGNSAAVQLSGSYTPTRFRVTHDGLASESAVEELTDTSRYARLDLWTADARVQLRPPVALGRVYPYAILGGGVVRYQLQDTARVPAEAQAGFRSGGRTQFAVTIGAGAMIPLQRNRLLLTFDLTDHLTRTPLTDDRESLVEVADGTKVLLRPGGERDDSGGVMLTSNVRLTVGVTIPLRIR